MGDTSCLPFSCEHNAASESSSLFQVFFVNVVCVVKSWPVKGGARFVARPTTHVYYQGHTQIKKIKTHIAFEQWPVCQKWGFTYNRRKNVRVWAQGIKSFLFCSSPHFKRTVGKFFFFLNTFDCPNITIYSWKRNKEHTGHHCEGRSSLMQVWDMSLWSQSAWPYFSVTHCLTMSLSFL